METYEGHSLLLFIILIIACSRYAEGSACKWDFFHCDRSEASCIPKETVLLNAKKPLADEQCFAIKDLDEGNYRNYEISVDQMSLKSKEGVNSGFLGIIFNYLDQMNYDFIYME